MAKTRHPIVHARRGDADFFKEAALDVLVNARNADGDSVLHVAALEGHLECCKQIYRRIPSLVYHQNDGRNTALHASAFRNRPQICKFLVYSDADGKTQNPQDDIESGSEGKTANMKLLTMVNAHGATALHVAVYYRATETARILIRADPSHELLRIVDHRKATALHLAVKLQSFETVQMLVEQEPDFDYYVDSSGKTPLLGAMTLALQHGDDNSVRIRKLMIEKQASQIKLPIGDDRWTVLHYAAARGDLSAIEDIIQFGADCLGLVDKDGRNFLHLAADHGHVNVVEHVLGLRELSVTIFNGQDNYGDTPLHIAARKGNTNAALCLLYDCRVNKKIKNEKGQTAVDPVTFDYDKNRAHVFGVRDRINEKEQSEFEKQLKDQSEFDLVVCALIATVSFTAGITVPGGYISEGTNEGMAVLYKEISFEAFVIANTCALLTSLSAMFSHFSTRMLQKRKDIDFHVRLATLFTLGAIFAMVVAFITGSYAVLTISRGLSIAVCVLCGSFFLYAFYAIGQMAKQYTRSPSSIPITS